MKEYLSKKIQRAKINFQNFRSKAVVRISNLAKRLEEEEKQEEASSPDRIIYRNFEFNLLGFAYSAVGTKEHRELLGPTLMDQILRYPEFSREKLPAEGSLCDWGLCVAIPLKLLGIQKGSRFKGNFQKCGDLTRAPHFLSWNSILSDEPDFHLPQFFGEMELVH